MTHGAARSDTRGGKRRDAARMRKIAQRVGVLAIAVLGFVPPAPAQVGYDRPGSDYLSFTVRGGDPAACAARCERDGRCRAWSFSYPRTKHVLATCSLKNKVVPREADTCCLSGVRGAGVIEPRRGPVEFGIDRTGGDFRNFELPSDPSGKSCQSACNGDERCRAWTYVRPGYAGASARCFLKSKIPRPHRKPCCISGVVR
jgi:PAN domain